MGQKNIGTLIGATVKTNDSADLYPVAEQVDIQGGHHSKTSIADRDAIPAHLRKAGMTCYVSGVGLYGTIYQLANDLVTWGSFNPTGLAGGGTGPAMLSDFGVWTAIPGKNANIINENVFLEYKLDVSGDQTRKTLFLRGQFSLNAAYVSPTILLGILPGGTRPPNEIKESVNFNGVDVYVIIEKTGEIRLTTKYGYNLPVDGVGVDQYVIREVYHPIILVPVYNYINSAQFIKAGCGAGTVGSSVTFTRIYTSYISLADATLQATNDATFAADGQTYANTYGTCNVALNYTASRNANFTRNDCGGGATGSIIPFTKTYTSTISQADAQSQADNDVNFNTDGQANANANGTCTVLNLDNVIVSNFTQFQRVNVVIKNNTGTNVLSRPTFPGFVDTRSIDPAQGPFEVDVTPVNIGGHTGLDDIIVTVNGVSSTLPAGTMHTFTGQTTPINVTVTLVIQP